MPHADTAREKELDVGVLTVHVGAPKLLLPLGAGLANSSKDSKLLSGMLSATKYFIVTRCRNKL